MPKVTIKYNTIAPWYGANTQLAAEVGKLLGDRAWVGVPFAGGMCELQHIRCKSIVVSDLHRHVINLARVIADPELHKRLAYRLDQLPFHPDVLRAAQRRCRAREEQHGAQPLPEELTSLDWAVDYFACAWMARNGKAGDKKEFDTGMSVRYGPGGGDSADRFRGATKSLAGWHQVMRRCTFVTQDCFEFLADAMDRERAAVYCDPPFPETGRGYKFAFTEEQHRRLAVVAGAFDKARVVMRFYDTPFIRSLYPPSRWECYHFKAKKQNHADGPEVLLVNRR